MADGLFSYAFDGSGGGAGSWLNRIEASSAISLLLHSSIDGAACENMTANNPAAHVKAARFNLKVQPNPRYVALFATNHQLLPGGNASR